MAISSVARSGLTNFDKFQRTMAFNVSANGTVVIRAGSSMFSSADGISWTSRGTTGSGVIIKRNNRLIITSGFNFTSTDGITWTNIGTATGASSTDSVQPTDPNGMYSEDNHILISTVAGSSWGMIAGDAFIRGLAGTSVNNGGIGRFGDNICYSVAAAPHVYSSTDQGISFTAATGVGGALNSMWVGRNGVVVGTYSNVITSSTNFGVTWADRLTIASGGNFLVKQINGLWVVSAGSGSNVIYTSTNGTSWTTVTHSLGAAFLDGIFANGLYILVGESGRILTSPDGVTWTSRTSGTANQINQVILA
jgi:hypothetical protein